MKSLLLASGSPRRAELLAQAGVPFRRLPPPDIDESVLPGEAPRDYVCRVAAAKALAGWQQLPASRQAGSAVLGADTSVVLDDTILGKPRDEADARAMLASLSGNEHQVMSAVTLLWAGQQRHCLSVSRVRFRALSGHDIDRYVATGEGVDKAGGYAIQGFGALLVEHISGSYSGIVGLPLEAIAPLLAEAGVPCWQEFGQT